MFTGLVLLVALVPLVALAAVVVVVVLTRAVPDAALLDSTAAARRHAVVGAALAYLASGLTLLCTPFAGAALGPRPLGVPGLPLVLAPAVAATVHVAVLAVVERTWPHPTGRLRAARLAPRSIAAVTPTPWLRALTVAVLALVATVAAGAVMAAQDGRSIEVSRGATSSSAGPFPGLPYGAAAFAAVAVLLVASALVLRLVVVRPAVAGADEPTDTALRRASAHRVLRAALAGTLLTLGPLLAFGGFAAAHAYVDASRDAALALAVAGLAVSLGALVAGCLPAPPVPLPSAPAAVAAR